MTPRWDARTEVRRRARAAGVDLPETTLDELAAHLDDVYDTARDEGASDADALARAAAALDESGFAPLTPHASRHRAGARARLNDVSAAAAAGGWRIGSGLRIALRQLRLAPTFAAVTILVLGLGSGAAATIFSVVDAVVLRPLPYRAPGRLVTLWDTNRDKGLTHDPISPVNFLDYRALPVFEDGAAWWRPAVNLVDAGQDPVRVRTIETTPNLFALLGVRPQLGAGFPQETALFNRERLAVISDRLWRTRYSADPAIVGRPLQFNGAPYTIAGVMPPGFHFPDDVDVWQRLAWDPSQHSRAAHFMEAVMRLADGTAPAEASAAVTTLASRLESDFARTNQGWGARLVPLLDDQLGYYRPALTVLLGAVALLLGIAMLNVASLLLTRALSRAREMAVRLALGASRTHLLVQLLTESAVLSIAGVAAGLAAAWITLPLVVAALPVTLPRAETAAVDVRALLVCLGIVVAMTLTFGLVPAVTALRTSPTEDLKSGDRGSSSGSRRLYAGVVAAQIAVACTLLACSALLVRSVSAMLRTPTGVDADATLTMPVQLTRDAVGVARTTPPDQAWRMIADRHAALLEELRRQPGVSSAGATNFLPLATAWRNVFALEGQPRPARREDLPEAQVQSVSEGYFEAMGVTVRQGRVFTDRDGVGAPPVVVVNESFVRRYLAGGDASGQRVRTWITGIGPLGLHLQLPEAAAHAGLASEIVGVVADVHNGPLGQPVEPAIFFAARQFPFAEMTLAVRATDAAAARTAMQAAMRRVVPGVPLAPMRTWGERFADTSAEARVLMAVLSAFGLLAAVLAALGVYGLQSWAVASQTRELAIRLTLGAKPARVGRAVLRQAALLVAAGLVVGLATVRGAEALLTRVLYNVPATDVTALGSAAVVLAVAALAAAVPPAVRAMRVDPAIGLRSE